MSFVSVALHESSNPLWYYWFVCMQHVYYEHDNNDADDDNDDDDDNDNDNCNRTTMTTMLTMKINMMMTVMTPCKNNPLASE